MIKAQCCIPEMPAEMNTHVFCLCVFSDMDMKHCQACTKGTTVNMVHKILSRWRSYGRELRLSRKKSFILLPKIINHQRCEWSHAKHIIILITCYLPINTLKRVLQIR